MLLLEPHKCSRLLCHTLTGTPEVPPDFLCHPFAGTPQIFPDFCHAFSLTPEVPPDFCVNPGLEPHKAPLDLLCPAFTGTPQLPQPSVSRPLWNLTLSPMLLQPLAYKECKSDQEKNTALGLLFP